MIRWLGRVLGASRTFTTSQLSYPSDRINIINSRTPQEALDGVYQSETINLHLKAYALRSIARCTRSTSVLLSDYRYLILQKEVLSNINSLNTGSITDLIFWMRTMLTYGSVNVVTLTESHKNALRIRLEELMNKSHFSNKQLASILMDVSLIGLKDTIFLEARLIDRLRDHNELFSYHDYLSILSSMSVRKMKVSRNLLEMVSTRMMKTYSNEVTVNVNSFRIVRQIMLSFSWFRLLELHQHFRDDLLIQEGEIGAGALRALIHTYLENPRIEFGLENMMERLIVNQWKEDVQIKDFMNEMRYFMVLRNLRPEKVSQKLISNMIARLAMMPLDCNVPINIWEDMLSALAINDIVLPTKLLDSFEAAVNGIPNRNPVCLLWISKLKAAAGVPAYLMSFKYAEEIAASNLLLTIKNSVIVLHSLLTHKMYPNRSLELISDAVFANMKSLESRGRIFYWFSAFNKTIWKGRAKIEHFAPVSNKLLMAIGQNFQNMAKINSLNVLRFFVLSHNSQVKSIIQNNLSNITPVDIELWVRYTEMTSELESFISMLALMEPTVALKALCNLFRFYQPNDSSASLIKLFNMIDKKPGNLLSERFFQYHSDLIMNLIRKFPSTTRPMQDRLARELSKIDKDQMNNETVLKTAVLLKDLNHPGLPKIDPMQLINSNQENGLLFITELFSNSNEVRQLLSNKTLGEHYGLIPKHMDKYRIIHKMNGFLSPAMESQSLAIKKMLTEFCERISASPLKTGVEFVKAIAPISDPRLSEAKLVSFFKLFRRFKKLTSPELDVCIEMLPIFKHLQIEKLKDADELIYIIHQDWAKLELHEKMQAVLGLTEIGYSSCDLFEKMIQCLLNREEHLINYGPDLLQCLHTVNVCDIPSMKGLYSQYLTIVLRDNAKLLNSIDFSKFSIAAMSNFFINKSHYETLRSIFPDYMHDMSLLRRYILALGFKRTKAISEDLTKVSPQLSNNIPTQLIEALESSKITANFNVCQNETILPVFLPKLQVVLWNPKDEHFLWYSGALCGDLAVYEHILKTQYPIFRVPQGFQSTKEASDWLRKKRLTE